MAKTGKSESKTKKSSDGFKKEKIVRNILIGGVCVCLVAGVAVYGLNRAQQVAAASRETTVQRGNLTVGVTESGKIEIGIVEQTFDLDMSQLVRVTTNNSNSSSSGSSSSFGGASFGSSVGGVGFGASGGGFDMGSMGGTSQGTTSGGSFGASSGGTSMFGQMFSLGGSSGSASQESDSKLIVESIPVTVGQEISEGDVILVLESEGVTELQKELQDNVDKVTADMEALLADQELSKITAEYTLKTSKQYGSYAAKEKSATLASLLQNVNDAQATIDAAKETLSYYEELLASATEDYNNVVIAMETALYSLNNYNTFEDMYKYVTAYDYYDSLKSTADSLKSKITQYESKIESTQSSITKGESTLASAKRNYESGKITAQETYELRMLAYSTAQETYDITMGYLEDDLKEQQEKYDDTLSKWEEFTSYIDGVNIVSGYSGTVTEISLAPGDSLTTNAVVISLYNADDVTMTVSVDEAEMNDISLGSAANVSLLAYPGEVFSAVVSEISDANSDNSGNVSYDVTVTIDGDLSKLYQGMTANVTFITRQQSDVCYVTNRAIIRESGRSYVKIKKDDGTEEKVEVVTGFSDGTNVEITKGLSEGQTVIIEKGDN